MAKYCENCGKKNVVRKGQKFCVYCGADLDSNASGAEQAVSAASQGGDQQASQISEQESTLAADAGPAEAATQKLSAAEIAAASEAAEATRKMTPAEMSPEASTQVLTPETIAAASPGGPKPPGRKLPRKWMFVAIVAAVLLAGGGSAYGAYSLFWNDSKPAASSTAAEAALTTSTKKDKKRDSTKSETKPRTQTQTQTKTRNSDRDNEVQRYIGEMDALIEDNIELEQLIDSYAAEINRTAPNISDDLFADIDRLSAEFMSINYRVQEELETPGSFEQAKRDFLLLTSYNMDRCNALYSGANAWASGQPFDSYFADGERAKDSYDDLYPDFEREYKDAVEDVS